MVTLEDTMRIITAARKKAVDVGQPMNIALNEAPQGYADFDQGVARKFVIDPHGSLKKSARVASGA
jgi:glutathione-independent formaldehyde dehydrogenase